MPHTIRLPAILYLAVLDRLGDSWVLGKVNRIESFSHLEHTLELAQGISELARAQQPRCAVRVPA